MAFPAFLDICVLVPIKVTDLLLRLAEADTYRILWFAGVLDEVERALPRIGVHPDKPVSSRYVTHFPDAMVTGYEALIPAMANHPRTDAYSPRPCDRPAPAPSHEPASAPSRPRVWLLRADRAGDQVAHLSWAADADSNHSATEAAGRVRGQFDAIAPLPMPGAADPSGLPASSVQEQRRKTERQPRHTTSYQLRCRSFMHHIRGSPSRGFARFATFGLHLDEATMAFEGNEQAG